MFIQTRLRTFCITPNDNICFPVGTIFAVCGQYEKPGFPAIFGKYKKRGRNLNSLIMALVSYKLYLRILVLAELGEWINQGEVLDIFGFDGLDFPDLLKRVKPVKLGIYEKAQQNRVDGY